MSALRTLLLSLALAAPAGVGARAEEKPAEPSFAGRWHVVYRDAKLGDIPGEAVVPKDEKSCTVTLWDESTKREHTLTASDLKRDGRKLTFTLNGRSPSSDAVKDDLLRLPRLPVPTGATTVKATAGNFRKEAPIKAVGRIDRDRVDLELTFDDAGDLTGRWTYHANPSTERDRNGLGRVGTYSEGEEEGRKIGLQSGPESWERRRSVIQGVVVLEEQLAWRNGSAVYGYPFKRGPKSAEKFAADLDENLKKNGEKDPVKRARAIANYLGDEIPYTFRQLLPAGEKIPAKPAGYTRRRLYVYGWNLPRNFDEKLVLAPKDSADRTVEYLTDTLAGSKSNGDNDRALLADGLKAALAGQNETAQALIKQMDAIVVDAVLHEGVVAGEHTFTLNGVASGTWPLLFGDATGSLSFARQKPRDGATELTDELLAPELAFVEVQTDFEYPIAEIPVQIEQRRKGAKPLVFSLTARRIAEHPRVFQTKPILIYEQGKENLAATADASVALKLPTASKDELVATLAEPRQLLAAPPSAHATLLAPREYGSLWKNALLRAARTHPEIDLGQTDLQHMSTAKATELTEYVLLEGLYLAAKERVNRVQREWSEWKTSTTPVWLQKKAEQALGAAMDGVKNAATGVLGPTVDPRELLPVRKVDVTCGDHAALLLLRDTFVEMMTAAEGHLLDVNDPRQLNEARAQLAAQIGDDASPFSRLRVTPPAGYRSWLSAAVAYTTSGDIVNDTPHAIVLRKLGIIGPKTSSGLIFDTDIPLKWAVSEDFLADFFKGDHRAADAWSRAAIKEGYLKYQAAVSASLAKAKGIEEKNVKELLELASYGFEPVTDRLLPRLMRLDDEPSAGAFQYRWVPDDQARVAVQNIYTLVEAYRAQEEYSKLDTQMVMVAAAAVSLPAMVWTDAAWAAYLAALADVPVGIATSVESFSDLKKNWEAQRFDLGASAVLGINRYDQAVAAEPGFWSTVATVLGGAVQTGFSGWNAIAKYRVSLALAELEKGGIAVFRELPAARQREFLAFAEEAKTVRAIEGEQKLGATQRRALAYWDEMEKAPSAKKLVAGEPVKPPVPPKSEPPPTEPIKPPTEPVGPKEPMPGVEPPATPPYEPPAPPKPPVKAEEPPVTTGGKETPPTKEPTSSAPTEPTPPPKEPPPKKQPAPTPPEKPSSAPGSKPEPKSIPPVEPTPTPPKKQTPPPKPASSPVETPKPKPAETPPRPATPAEPAVPKPAEKPTTTGTGPLKPSPTRAEAETVNVKPLPPRTEAETVTLPPSEAGPRPVEPAKPKVPKPSEVSPTADTVKFGKPPIDPKETFGLEPGGIGPKDKTVVLPSEPAKPLEPLPPTEKITVDPLAPPEKMPGAETEKFHTEFPPERETSLQPAKPTRAEAETVTLPPSEAGPRPVEPAKPKVPKLPEVSETADTVKLAEPPIDRKEIFGLEPGGVGAKDKTVVLPKEPAKPGEPLPPTEKFHADPLAPTEKMPGKETEKFHTEFPPERETTLVPAKPTRAEAETITLPPSEAGPRPAEPAQPKVPKLPEVSETADTVKFGKPPIDPKETFGLEPGGVGAKDKTVVLPKEPMPADSPFKPSPSRAEAETITLPPSDAGPRPVEPLPPTEKFHADPLAPTEKMPGAKTEKFHTEFPPERETKLLPADEPAAPKPGGAKPEGIKPSSPATPKEELGANPGAVPEPIAAPAEPADAPTVHLDGPTGSPDVPTVRNEPRPPAPAPADATPPAPVRPEAAPGANPVPDETPTIRGVVTEPPPPAPTPTPATAPADAPKRYVEPAAPTQAKEVFGPPPKQPGTNTIYSELPDTKVDGFWYRDPSSQKLFYLEKRLGNDSAFSQVYTVGGAGNEELVVKFRVRGENDYALKTAREMVVEYEQASRDLANAQIPQMKVRDVNLEGNPPYVFVDKLPPDATMFSMSEFSGDVRPAAFDLAHQRAVVRLYEQLADAQIAAKDLHIENIYFRQVKGQGVVAGILDHDFIQPWAQAKTTPWVDFLEKVPNMPGHNIMSMKPGQKFQSVEEFMAKMFEHKAWIDYDRKAGAFKPHRMELDAFKGSKFEKYLVPPKPSAALPFRPRSLWIGRSLPLAA